MYPGHGMAFSGGSALSGGVGTMTTVPSVGGVVGASNFAHKGMSHLGVSGSTSTVLIVNNLDPGVSI